MLEPLSELGPEPLLGAAIYEARLAAARERMERSGLDALLVYADREHYANVSYLTGFDPRFEEALLLVPRAGEPVVLAGNESLSFVDRAGTAVRGVLCQSFSLPSQDRSVRRRVSDALAEAGLGRGDRAGVIGWKPVPREDAPDAPYALAVPQFVLSEIESFLDSPPVDATLELCGVDGLRAHNEADQLALHEHRATRASHSVWRAIEALRPGVTELELSRAMGLVGLPLACHVMCTSGAESFNGLSSPTDREIGVGDRFSAAVGYWGGLCCRAGLVLEAGHLISLDEWLDSPFFPGSEHTLRSGAALQCDIIPTSERYPGDAANVEDSLALADEELRAEIAERYPETWSRVEGRRRFMAAELGIELADEVLPFSDRQAAFAPALLSPAELLRDV
jgi:Creatinase/Prolidase N-terminal domain